MIWNRTLTIQTYTLGLYSFSARNKCSSKPQILKGTYSIYDLDNFRRKITSGCFLIKNEPLLITEHARHVKFEV